jgi:hypothetical protein
VADAGAGVDCLRKQHGYGCHLVIERGAHDDDLFLPSPRIGEAILAHLKGQPVAIERIALPPLRFRTP